MVHGGALVAVVGDGIAQVDVLSHVLGINAVVAVVFSGDSQRAVAVDVDHAEALAVSDSSS